MNRCEWNPSTSRPATEPAGEGDCPNEQTVRVGVSGRFHLCASCASLEVFVKSGLKQGPILTTEERHAQLMALTWKDCLRERLEIAIENAPSIPNEVDAAKVRSLLRVVERLLDDPRAEASVRRALMKAVAT